MEISKKALFLVMFLSLGTSYGMQDQVVAQEVPQMVTWGVGSLASAFLKRCYPISSVYQAHDYISKPEDKGPFQMELGGTLTCTTLGAIGVWKGCNLSLNQGLGVVAVGSLLGVDLAVRNYGNWRRTALERKVDTGFADLRRLHTESHTKIHEGLKGIVDGQKQLRLDLTEQNKTMHQETQTLVFNRINIFHRAQHKANQIQLTATKALDKKVTDGFAGLRGLHTNLKDQVVQGLAGITADANTKHKETTDILTKMELGQKAVNEAQAKALADLDRKTTENTRAIAGVSNQVSTLDQKVTVGFKTQDEAHKDFTRRLSGLEQDVTVVKTEFGTFRTETKEVLQGIRSDMSTNQQQLMAALAAFVQQKQTPA